MCSATDDRQKHHEEIDDVQIEVERGKDIFLGGARVLMVATYNHLGVKHYVLQARKKTRNSSNAVKGIAQKAYAYNRLLV